MSGESTRLRIAVLGVGRAGARQVEAIFELDRKVVVDCIVDNDVDFLKARAAELGIPKTYANFQDALADPEVDAVSICLPHALHAPVAVEAAAAGKHILCEKPIALEVDEATRMINAAEENQVKLYVAESEVYTPMARFLRQLVERGEEIGELTGASMVKGFQGLDYGYPGRRAWLSTPELGGTGTWMLHGIHSMAQLRFILGEVETVYVQTHRTRAFRRRDLEATMSGLLTMARGIHVAVMQTCETRLGDPLKGYVFYGEKGSVRASGSGCEVFGPEGEPRSLTYPPEELSAYAQEIEDFADYVAGGPPGPTTGQSERRSLAIVQAGYESAQTGEPVDLKARFGDL